MSGDFHPLRVIETDDHLGGEATTVTLEVPSRLRDVFSWLPGQHVTLRFHHKGAELRRTYSISSPGTNGPIQITVKRVDGGLVSNYINDHVRAGDRIEALAPTGGFCLDPGAAKRRTHYFFGAGSGITPLYAMLNSVLTAEPHSVAHLAYGNTNHKTILFKDALDALATQYPDRLTLNHVFSRPLIWSLSTPWRTGHIDKAAIRALIDENPPYAQDAQYYICGPGGMNSSIKAALVELDVPPNRLHMESYGGAGEIDDTVQGIPASAHVALDETAHTVPVAADQSILDAVRAAGLNPPFSCVSGVCGICRARLISGSVHMRAHMALEDTEINGGAILTCQSLATSPKLRIRYE